MDYYRNLEVPYFSQRENKCIWIEKYPLDSKIIEGTDGIEQSRYEKPNQADNVHSFPPVLSGPIKRKK